MFAALFRLSLPVHLVAAGAAFAAFQAIKVRLDASYAASQHPVDYATGQLAFDAEVIEGYYAHMTGVGTLDIYWQTQILDFAFIAAVMVLSALLGTLAARLGGRINRLGTWGWRLGVAAALAGVSGALFDALENLLSFAMLARPEAIAPALALAYSSAAAAKFALLTAAMAAFVLSLLAGGTARLVKAMGRSAGS